MQSDRAFRRLFALFVCLALGVACGDAVDADPGSEPEDVDDPSSPDGGRGKVPDAGTRPPRDSGADADAGSDLPDAEPHDADASLEPSDAGGDSEVDAAEPDDAAVAEDAADAGPPDAEAPETRCTTDGAPGVFLNEVEGLAALDEHTVLTLVRDAMCAVPTDGSAPIMLTGDYLSYRVFGGQVVLVQGFDGVFVWKRGMLAPRRLITPPGTAGDGAMFADGSGFVWEHGFLLDSALLRYDFASDTVTELEPAVEDGFFELSPVLGGIGYSVYHPSPAWNGAYSTLRVVHPDGSRITLCDQCSSLVTGAATSPWILASTVPLEGSQVSRPIQSSGATLFHVDGVQRRDLGAALHVFGGGRMTADGADLYALGRNGGVARYTIATGASSVLSPLEPWHSWVTSPDGNWVSFARVSGGVSHWATSTSGPALDIALGSWPTQGNPQCMGLVRPDGFTKNSSHAIYQVDCDIYTRALGAGAAAGLPLDNSSAGPFGSVASSVHATHDSEIVFTREDQIMHKNLASGVETVIAPGRAATVAGSRVFYKSLAGQLVAVPVP